MHHACLRVRIYLRALHNAYAHYRLQQICKLFFSHPIDVIFCAPISWFQHVAYQHQHIHIALSNRDRDFGQPENSHFSKSKLNTYKIWLRIQLWTNLVPIESLNSWLLKCKIFKFFFRFTKSYSIASILSNHTHILFLLNILWMFFIRRFLRLSVRCDCVSWPVAMHRVRVTYHKAMRYMMSVIVIG